MPRKTKKDEEALDVEASAIAEALENTQVEELVARLAAEAESKSEEEAEASADEGEAEPVLAAEDGDAGGDDASGAEGADDAQGDAEPAEAEEAEEVPVVADPAPQVRWKDTRQFTGGGMSVVTT